MYRSYYEGKLLFWLHLKNALNRTIPSRFTFFIKVAGRGHSKINNIDVRRDERREDMRQDRREEMRGERTHMRGHERRKEEIRKIGDKTWGE